MSLLEAIFLGILQGATEFLPISSSGHLVLVPAVFNLAPPDLVFIGLVHTGTLLAVLIYFRQDIIEILRGWFGGLRTRQPMGTTESRLGWYILAGTIPAALAGLLLESFFEEVFGTPIIAAFFLLVTGTFLVIGERLLSGKKTLATMGWTDAIVIGLFQMLALFPGLSRSGSTITGGLLRGLDRPTAARYSFLLGIPAIAGAGLLSIIDIFGAERTVSLGVYAGGFIAAAVSGYLCIAFLLSWVRTHSLYIFAAYCFLVGGLYLAFNLF
jgi:undecaprenyl-diphosphatase